VSQRVAQWAFPILLATLALSAAPANAAVSSISAGFKHTCVVKTGGTPVCWGVNDDGESNPNGVGNLSQVTAGGYHTCGRKADGTPVCWGDNFLLQTTLPAGIGLVTQISAGFTHSCAIKTDGTPVCWGENEDGQNTIPADASTVTQISAGGHHTCAIKTDATPRCWGWTFYSQSTIPAGVGTVSQISAGLMHTCAVRTDGTSACWGDNRDGQATVPADIGTVTQISAGALHTCAIKTGGAAVCWGSNVGGRSTVPPSLGAVSQISAGFNHTCAVKTDGVAVCWGADDLGQRGTPPAITSAPAPGTASAGPYSHTVTATGSLSPSLAVTSGSLPPGLTLASGRITGTPTQAGVFTGTITASDGIFADATQNFSIAVDITPPTVTISAPVNGATYTQGRSVRAAYSCSDACTGTVAAGAPVNTQAIGKRSFTVTARDAAGNATTKTVAYTVLAPPPAPDTVGPVVTIPRKNKTLVQRKGVVRFTLGKALERTTGTVALKAKSLKVGSASFTAAAGQAVTLKIRLSGKAKKTLAKRGKLKVQALITVRDSAGNATVKTFKLTLKQR
jgi:hypothetical protein